MNEASYLADQAIRLQSETTARRDTLLAQKGRLARLDSLSQERVLSANETIERNRLFFGHPDRDAAIEAAEQELATNEPLVAAAQAEHQIRQRVLERIPRDRSSRLALNETTIREQARYMQLVALPEATINQGIVTERESLETDNIERLTLMGILDKQLYGGDSSRWVLVGVGVAAYVGMWIGIAAAAGGGGFGPNISFGGF